MSVEVQIPNTALKTVTNADLSSQHDVPVTQGASGKTADLILLCKPKLHVRREGQRQNRKSRRERANTETYEQSETEQSESTEQNKEDEREISLISSEAITDVTSTDGTTDIISVHEDASHIKLHTPSKADDVETTHSDSERLKEKSRSDSTTKVSTNHQNPDVLSQNGSLNNKSFTDDSDECISQVTDRPDKDKTQPESIILEKSNTKLTYTKSNPQENIRVTTNTYSLSATQSPTKKLQPSKIPTPRRGKPDTRRDIAVTNGNKAEGPHTGRWPQKSHSIEEEIDEIAKNSLQLIKKSRIKKEIKLVSRSLNKTKQDKRTENLARVLGSSNTFINDKKPQRKTVPVNGDANVKANDSINVKTYDTSEKSHQKQKEGIIKPDHAKDLETSTKLNLSKDLNEISDSGSDTDLYGPQPPKTPTSTRQSITSGLHKLSPVNLDTQKTSEMDPSKDNPVKGAENSASSINDTNIAKTSSVDYKKQTVQQGAKTKSHVKSFKVGIKRQRSYVKSATPDPNRGSQIEK